MINPGIEHWRAIKGILRYLKGTVNYALHFDGNNTEETTVSGYSDADWGGEVDTRCSKTGYLIYWCGGVISWRSKLQTCIAQSTVEAEYVAANETGRELIWARQLVEEMGYPQITTTLYEDNQGCKSTVENPIVNDRVKHIDIKYHWIRLQAKNKIIKLKYCHTSLMTADILTKALPVPAFQKHRLGMGVMELALRVAVDIQS